MVSGHSPAQYSYTISLYIHISINAGLFFVLLSEMPPKRKSVNQSGPAKRARRTPHQDPATVPMVDMAAMLQATQQCLQQNMQCMAQMAALMQKMAPQQSEPNTAPPTAPAAQDASDTNLAVDNTPTHQPADGQQGEPQTAAGLQTQSDPPSNPQDSHNNGESHSVCDEFEPPQANLAHPPYQINARPVQYAPPRPENQVSQTLKDDIHNHKYIDFHQLLRYSVSERHTPSHRPNDNATKQRPLSYEEWEQAWVLFEAVYAEKYTEANKDLRCYRADIARLKASGANWRYYDENYRTDREISKCSWDTVRSDLMNEVMREAEKRKNQPFRAPRQGSQTSSSVKIPKGHCYAYHSEGRRCEDHPCDYKHYCFLCGNKHPHFKCKSPSSSQKSHSTSNSTSKSTSTKKSGSSSNTSPKASD